MNFDTPQGNFDGNITLEGATLVITTSGGQYRLKLDLPICADITKGFITHVEKTLRSMGGKF